MKKVVVLRIEDYSQDRIKERIKEALYTHFSFLENFSPQDKILLKPNLLMSSLPQEAIVTHPLFIEAVGDIFKERGCLVSIADNPGGFINKENIKEVYQNCGLYQLAKEKGFNLIFSSSTFLLDGYPFSQWVRSFKIINLPKLKTHQLMLLTLATKNLYGCIQGTYKSQLHRLYPKTDEFVKVIIKLYKIIKPQLNIVDGILALEGEGPSRKGSPRKLGMVVIGDDALYTDYIITKLLGIPEKLNPLIRIAKKMNLLEEKIEVISEIECGRLDDFHLPSPSLVNSLPSSLLAIIKLFVDFKPWVNIKNCQGCSICHKVCPTKSIEMKKFKAWIVYKECIKCMCCQEVCPYGAIEIRKSLMLKVMEYLRKNICRR